MVPGTLAPPGFSYLPRLASQVTAKIRIDFGVVCNAIRRNATGALYFCDTNIFSDDMNAELWDALLSGRDKLALIPAVRLELKDWLARRPEHPIAQAAADNHPAIRKIDLNRLADWEKESASYYVALLNMRKQVLRSHLRRAESARGRELSTQERISVERAIEQGLGQRSYHLAQDGLRERDPVTYFTDEWLVYLATATAITTGRHVVILSNDEGVQEQLFKLCWLLKTHYFGMLLADRYIEDFAIFRSRFLPMTSDTAATFMGGNNILIERPERLAEYVLPRECSSVAVSYMSLGAYFTQMEFAAEREMSRLLRVKGQTKGRNTDRLGSRNCHAWLAPLDVAQRYPGWAAIAEDRIDTLGTILIPHLDHLQAVNEVEAFERLVQI